MLFPRFASYLDGMRNTPQGQQQQSPGLYQQMPQTGQQGNGKQRQMVFNQEQEEMNKGMIGGKFNRRGY